MLRGINKQHQEFVFPGLKGLLKIWHQQREHSWFCNCLGRH
jgi:hypothetical protein